jgi:hypothetical protein
METIIETPNSSNVKRYGYRDSVLFVEFRSGDEWEYEAPISVFDKAKKAKSIGKFLHAEVKGNFPGVKVN